jgi:hypothetical protein
MIHHHELCSIKYLGLVPMNSKTVFETIHKRFLNKFKNHVKLRLPVLNAANITVFWDVAPYGLLETDRRFRGAYHLHHQTDVEGSQHL